MLSVCAYERIARAVGRAQTCPSHLLVSYSFVSFSFSHSPANFVTMCFMWKGNCEVCTGRGGEVIN